MTSHSLQEPVEHDGGREDHAPRDVAENAAARVSNRAEDAPGVALQPPLPDDGAVEQVAVHLAPALDGRLRIHVRDEVVTAVSHMLVEPKYLGQLLSALSAAIH